jgi:hypothetical protein
MGLGQSFWNPSQERPKVFDALYKPSLSRGIPTGTQTLDFVFVFVGNLEIDPHRTPWQNPNKTARPASTAGVAGTIASRNCPLTGIRGKRLKLASDALPTGRVLSFI